MKILFITNKYGDLGNRLFRFARLYSALYPYRIFIVDISFYQYAHFYCPKSLKYWITFRILGLIKRKNIFVNIVKLINSCRFIQEVKFVEKSNNEWNSQKINQIYELITKAKNIFLKIECSELYSEISHCNSEIKKEINRIFHVKNKYSKIAASIVKKNSQNFYLGVHIRRGDFKEFWGGQWYFEDDIYIKNIINLLESINTKKNVKLVLVSNEILNIQNWSEFDYIYFPQSCPVVDQEILKKCDAILASWSSFSTWPAFMKNIPFGLINADAGVDWKQFHIPSEYLYLHEDR